MRAIIYLFGIFPVSVNVKSVFLRFAGLPGMAPEQKINQAGGITSHKIWQQAER